MSIERKPEILSVSPMAIGQYGRGRGIYAKIVLKGIKGEPIEDYELTPQQAVKLIEQLSIALSIVMQQKE